LTEAALALCGVEPNRYFGFTGDYWKEVKGANGIDGFVRFQPRAWKIEPEPVPIFVKHKPANGFRLFVVGDSPVVGWPHDVGGMCDWMQSRLAAMLPHRTVEVVNTANPGWHANECVDLLRECVKHKADAFVWMPGSSEWTIQNMWETRQALAMPIVAGFARVPRESRIVALLSRLTPSFALQRRYFDPETTEARRPFTEAEIAMVKTRFTAALRAGVDTARRAGAPILLCTPPRNLRTYVPVSSLHTHAAGTPARNRWDALYAEGLRSRASNPVASLAKLGEALALDDRPAKLHYELGKACEVAGDWARARRHYVTAIDNEAQPTRPQQWTLTAIRVEAQRLDVPLVDVERSFNARGVQNLAGPELLLDNVHPTLEGQRLIADWILDALEKTVPITLRRDLDVNHLTGRLGDAMDRQTRYLSGRGAALSRLPVAVERGEDDPAWKECIEASESTALLAPDDHEVRAAGALLRAARDQDPRALDAFVKALEADANVKLVYLTRQRTNQAFRRVLSQAKAPMDRMASQLTPDERNVLERRISRVPR
jgi:tetratricopeptide (TPR) repeat protein